MHILFGYEMCLSQVCLIFHYLFCDKRFCNSFYCCNSYSIYHCNAITHLNEILHYNNEHKFEVMFLSLHLEVKVMKMNMDFFVLYLELLLFLNQEQ